MFFNVGPLLPPFRPACLPRHAAPAQQAAAALDLYALGVRTFGRGALLRDLANAGTPAVREIIADELRRRGEDVSTLDTLTH